MGRSKGGLSTKIHALVDALGNPLRFLLTPGQVHDLVGAGALLPQIAAGVLIADTAFDADDRVIRRRAAAGQSAVIPPRRNRLTPRAFDQKLDKARHLIIKSAPPHHKTRHLIENFCAKLKQFRAIAPRYDKTARNFSAAVHLAAATIWLNRRHDLASLDSGEGRSVARANRVRAMYTIAILGLQAACVDSRQ
jgi:transposase